MKAKRNLLAIIASIVLIVASVYVIFFRTNINGFVPLFIGVLSLVFFIVTPVKSHRFPITVDEFMKETGCSRETAEEIFKSVRRH